MSKCITCHRPDRHAVNQHGVDLEIGIGRDGEGLAGIRHHAEHAAWADRAIGTGTGLDRLVRQGQEGCVNGVVGADAGKCITIDRTDRHPVDQHVGHHGPGALGDGIGQVLALDHRGGTARVDRPVRPGTGGDGVTQGGVGDELGRQVRLQLHPVRVRERAGIDEHVADVAVFRRPTGPVGASQIDVRSPVVGLGSTCVPRDDWIERQICIPGRGVVNDLDAVGVDLERTILLKDAAQDRGLAIRDGGGIAVLIPGPFPEHRDSTGAVAHADRESLGPQVHQRVPIVSDPVAEWLEHHNEAGTVSLDAGEVTSVETVVGIVVSNPLHPAEKLHGGCSHPDECGSTSRQVIGPIAGCCTIVWKRPGVGGKEQGGFARGNDRRADERQTREGRQDGGKRQNCSEIRWVEDFHGKCSISMIFPG